LQDAGRGAVGQNVGVTEPSLPNAPRHRRKIFIAVGGWAALAATSYLTLPIFGIVGLAGWLIIAGCWVWALAASGFAIASLARHRAYGRAVVSAGLAIVAAVGTWHADWLALYLDSQVWLHRDTLDELVTAHRGAHPPADTPLPWQIRYLSIDGRAHWQTGTNALYLPMWQNWRGEAGGGLVYLTEPLDADAAIVTAPGGVGMPDRYIGDGWWWVQGD
jgi:hypothetical protein